MPDPDDARLQKRAHDVITDLLRDIELLDEGNVLSGFVICFETVNVGGGSSVGWVRAPDDMSSWRAAGLLGWIKAGLEKEAG